MTKRLKKTRARLTLPLFFLLVFVTGIAHSDTFKGMLIPRTLDGPMPIVVELENSEGLLSGKVAISSNLVGRGPIISGEKSGYRCTLNSDLGGGIFLRMTGTCTPNVFVGRYSISIPDARTRLGTFRLIKVQTENKEPSKIEKKSKSEEQSTDKTQAKRFSTTECLKMNSACLGTCPRGDYNAEFLCTNGCRRKLTACKAKGKDATKNLAVEPDKPDKSDKGGLR
ncbi:MAG TPA: hypothetical protein VGQ54_08915 [Burkholderiales bacterium]|jgi:hypothetical protein|nr:hypothetical protein [Burkholderiales bacterium]